MSITSNELRNKFLKYFENKKHSIISSASLIPENDPTVLFITAGMQPLVPYLIGEKHPAGTRLANVQKCWRTGDIDEVGDKTHHTFFEMLGNWSLGDYGKKEATELSWEFLTKIMNINPKNLAISIFGGNDDIINYDQEAEKHWLDLAVPATRIAKLSDNWWGPAGKTGPCGPDTEIFYWSGKEKAPATYDPKDDTWVEIWNNVFMEYNKNKAGQFNPLQQKNIDTGMGLERTLAALNGLDDNYLTDLFLPIIEKIEKLSGKKYNDDKKTFRIVADHLRSATFLLGDPQSMAPANTGQGYVLRRVIRRAVRFGKNLGIKDNFTKEIAQVVIKKYQDVYPELKDKQNFILAEIEKEELKFNNTLQQGLKQFEKFIKQNALDEKAAFNLFATYGFPLEMTLELAAEKGLKLAPEKYQEEFTKHQELSRTASAGMFKGGLADDGEMSKKYHTATHLLHQALRNVLGDHVEQRGSNINAERMRFDFTHTEKMTPEQIKKVEDLINQQIKNALEISSDEMTVEEAKDKGAIGLFAHKYGEKIKVYTVGDSKKPFSQEICGGPHVANTSVLGQFKISKESSSSAGIRRIKAVLS
jgi:alanyl-tRNA synthetase